MYLQALLAEQVLSRADIHRPRHQFALPHSAKRAALRQEQGGWYDAPGSDVHDRAYGERWRLEGFHLA
eukprot:COSAG04_NODE_987_length_8947_cov_6.409245_6_plen_68_part_00